ncbi:transcription termination factor MTERF15, mitochondrial-like [Silene latifolia]|uniref:transcription termination factor MTERF15, mitochondrial-like n=1 Tax=Silene latifolia TaxID=37657 RepID=UPI003D7850A2
MLRIRCCKCSVQVADYYLHNFQHLLQFSTNSSNQNPKFPNQSYTNYLINNLGFSNQQAHSISTKLPYKFDDAHFPKFSGNANSVIHFLKQHDFNDTHIKKVVSYYPQILSANVDQTLKPRFQVFQDHGFSASNLVSLISSNPFIASRHMDPIIPDLRAILGSTDNLIKFFRKIHLSMGQSDLGNLNSNVELLNKEYGVDINVIRNAILQSPRAYVKNTEFFQNAMVRVEKELGIPRNSGMFTYGIHLLCGSSKKRIESKCQVFKSFGWTEYDVSELMRRNPLLLLTSEENIRKKLGFLMTELGYKPDFLAIHSTLLGNSLEKRLAPRHRVLLVLKEKGLLDYSFHTAAKMTEKQFLKIFIEPFKDDAPALLELYQSSKGYSNIDAISRH